MDIYLNLYIKINQYLNKYIYIDLNIYIKHRPRFPFFAPISLLATGFNTFWSKEMPDLSFEEDRAAIRYLDHIVSIVVVRERNNFSEGSQL